MYVHTPLERKRPHIFGCYVTLMSSILDSGSSKYDEATGQQCWKYAMMEEYESILKNDVWENVLRLYGKPVVTSRWIFKIKHVADGSIEKYKERFVASEFSQKEGVDYNEIFAPISRYTSIKMIIDLSSSMGWRLHQTDVKTTFLNGKIKEEVYVEYPNGFLVHWKEPHVCRKKKASYGLK